MLKISAVARDSAGRLTTWVEGGVQIQVSRDSAGRPLVARTVGASRLQLVEFKYDLSGSFTGIVGELQTTMLPSLLSEAAAGGATPVTADAASGALSSGRTSVEKTLLVGAYADQSLPADDYTLSATGVACAQRGFLTGVELLAGTGVTLTLQDCPDAASGRTVWSIPATSAPRRWDFPKPLPFHTGLYATIGGTGPSVKFLFGGRE